MCSASCASPFAAKRGKKNKKGVASFPAVLPPLAATERQIRGFRPAAFECFFFFFLLCRKRDAWLATWHVPGSQRTQCGHETPRVVVPDIEAARVRREWRSAVTLHIFFSAGTGTCSKASAECPSRLGPPRFRFVHGARSESGARGFGHAG